MSIVKTRSGFRAFVHDTITKHNHGLSKDKLLVTTTCYDFHAYYDASSVTCTNPK